MNDLLKDKLASLDDLMITALKTLFAERLEKEKPQILEGQENILIGEKYRAYEIGRLIIERTFEDLKLFKISKKSIQGFNKEI